jgi:hypothetical protein
MRPDHRAQGRRSQVKVVILPYSDYAALKAENERLKTERNHYQWASINDGIACNERARENQDLENQIDALKAENERLRKAGDAVIEKLAEAYAGEPSDFDHAHVFKGWIEAKGVQS